MPTSRKASSRTTVSLKRRDAVGRIAELRDRLGKVRRRWAARAAVQHERVGVERAVARVRAIDVVEQRVDVERAVVRVDREDGCVLDRRAVRERCRARGRDQQRATASDLFDVGVQGERVRDPVDAGVGIDVAARPADAAARALDRVRGRRVDRDGVGGEVADVDVSGFGMCRRGRLPSRSGRRARSASRRTLPRFRARCGRPRSRGCRCCA